MKINQIKAGVILNYVQLFLGVVVSLFITPFIIRGLGQSEYGIYSLSASTTSYLSLITLGIGGAFLKFNTQYRVKNDKEGEQRLNSTFIIIYLIFSTLIAIIGAILVIMADKMFANSLTTEEIRKVKIVMSIDVFNMAFALPFSVFSMNINAYEKFVFAKSINILNTVVSPLVRLPIVLLGGKAIEITIAMATIHIITCFIQMFYAIFRLHIKFKFGKIEKSLVFKMFSFSFFIFLNQVVDMINWSMDNFILGVACGTTMVAIYTVGATFNRYTLDFSTAIAGVISPRIYTLVEKNTDIKEIDNVFIKTGRIQFIIVAFIITAFSFFGKSFIVNIYADASYEEAYYIALLLIVPLIIPLTQNVGIEIQRAMNKHKFRSLAYIIMAVLNLCVSIPLAINFGGIGAAIGTCISLLVGNGLIMNIYYAKSMHLDIKRFWWNILKFIPALVIPCTAGALFMVYVDMSNIGIFILCAIAYTLIYLISMFLIGMNRYEKDLFRNPFIKIIDKIKKKKSRVDVIDGE